MASVRQKGNRYEARVRVVGFPSESVTFDTYEDAEWWAVNREKELKPEFKPRRRRTGEKKCRRREIRYKPEDLL